MPHPDKNIEEMFQRWGKEPPAHFPHGTTDEIRANLKQAKCTNWRMEGNKLMADTDFGPLVQIIPTNYICHGTDDKGMPILVKLNV